MAQHRCCPGVCEKQDCCNSGCECWHPEYDLLFTGPIDLGTYKGCSCCGRCTEDPPECTETGDCCFEEEFSITGLRGRLYRTGSYSLCDTPYEFPPRFCPDPWTPPTKTLEELGADCNVYESDYGLCLPNYEECHPCPDAEAAATAEMDFEYYAEVYGDACEDCEDVVPWAVPQLSHWLEPGTTVDEVRVQATVPVKLVMKCCGEFKVPCAPCDDTVPGSGVTHVLEIEPLAGVQFTFQGTTRTIVPPKLRFFRNLDCESKPDGGGWDLDDRVLDLTHPCGEPVLCDIPCAEYLCGCECPEECPDPCWDIDECVGCREWRDGSGSTISLVEVDRE